MIWVGITGGIGTGKTTASEHLRRRGYPVIDADELARQVVSIGSSGLSEVIKEFGTSFLTPDGSLDRIKMGQLIFKDSSARERLEKIIHPLVQVEVEKFKNQALHAGADIAFYDVPLLFEKNLQKNFNFVILVTSDHKLQRQRLQTRNRFSDEEIVMRLKSQMNLSEKLKKSDFVVENNKGLKELYSELDLVVSQILQKANSKPR